MATSSSLLIGDALDGTRLMAVRKLFQEYGSSLGVDPCLQGFEQEVRNLPGHYAPPAGRLLLGGLADEPAGCVAIRLLESGVCELKRLYVRPSYRKDGIGRLLVERAIQEARSAGYSQMRLDTLPSMHAALALYRRLGFLEIAPYTGNPVEGAVFLELQLEPSSS